MNAPARLGLSLVLCAGIGALLFAGVQWATEEAAPEIPPAVPAGDARAASGPEAGESPAGADPERARIEKLQAAIDAQRAALRRARQQRGDAASEIDRLTDDLSVIRERIESLQERVAKPSTANE